jgi:hypothetical protein
MYSLVRCIADRMIMESTHMNGKDLKIRHVEDITDEVTVNAL